MKIVDGVKPFNRVHVLRSDILIDHRMHMLSPIAIYLIRSHQLILKHRNFIIQIVLFFFVKKHHRLNFRQRLIPLILHLRYFNSQLPHQILFIAHQKKRLLELKIDLLPLKLLITEIALSSLIVHSELVVLDFDLVNTLLKPNIALF